MPSLISLLLFIASLSIPLSAENSTAEFFPENTFIAPGIPFTVAISLSHPEEWHSYYKNSGGVELPLSLTWDLPLGTEIGPIQWPTPEVKDGFGGKSFIYPGNPIFLIEITPPAEITIDQAFPVKVKANWQICKLSCINEEASFQIDLPFADLPQRDPSQKTFFSKARSKVAPSLPETSSVEATYDQEEPDRVQLKVSPPVSDLVDFIPDQAYLKPLSDGGTFASTDESTLITLARKTLNLLDQPIPQGNLISGILLSTQPSKFPETKITATQSEPLPASGFFPILGGMFLGGLLLNLMPCVFPVIGLKVMGFVQQAGENRRNVFMHGIAFALGVFASFAVLAGTLFAIRAAAVTHGADAIGWGYQLQNPWIVFALLILMFLLALNMFGLFEVGTSATSFGGRLHNKSGHSGSFFSGVLATIVATPCSAPFLGAAIGAAIVLPALQFFSAFAAMAIGLALPYLLLTSFPKLIDHLPRPGPWMESFKQAMSFLLFATAAYLLWVYSGLIGQENLLLPLIGLCLIAAAAWIYGRWFLPHHKNRTRTAAIFLGLSLLTAGIAISAPKKADNFWEVWSPEIVADALAEGRPVFVDFTAQWCLTCQVNKKVAYSKEVREIAKKKNILFLKADKTRPNPEIDAHLAELGRSAIPVNTLTLPGKKPLITPEILSPGILEKIFSEIP